MFQNNAIVITGGANGIGTCIVAEVNTMVTTAGCRRMRQ